MPEERRRYFRIDDTAQLHATLVKPDEIESRLDDFWNNQHLFSIRNEYNHQLEQHLADFNAIENKMPELARYLSILQKQIESLTNKLIPEQSQFANPQQVVNISAQGVSYYSDDAFEPGDLLELELKLLPSGQQLVIFARVTKINGHDNSELGKFRVSLDFEHIHDADQEILIKHVHSKNLRSLVPPQSEDN
jgi:c-di-GMP-binding flagellar brake protein YcgR